MPGKRTTDVLFILKRIQEKYRDKGRHLYMFFVDLDRESVQSCPKEGNGVGNEEERFTRDNGQSNHEYLR